jgi:hypothetical protein
MFWCYGDLPHGCAQKTFSEKMLVQHLLKIVGKILDQHSENFG